MGKRELLLMVVFVLLGVGVYQVTAPAAPADASGFSIGRLVQFAKAHFHGASARRTVTRTATLTPSDAVTTIDIGEVHGTIIIEGTDRPDVQVRLEAVLAGIDEPDLDAQEKALGLSMASTGETAAITLAFDHAGRRPRYELRVDMPRGLKVQVRGRGSAEVSNVAGLHFVDFRGDVSTDSLGGPITGELHEARAEFGPGARLTLQSRQGRLRADAPAEVTLDAERTAIEIVDPAGPITIEQEYARMEIRGTGGPVKITGEGGVVTLREVSHPLTIDAERLTVTAELEVPVATTIAVEDDEVEVSLPRTGGVQVEASIEDGALRLPPELTSTTTDRTQSVSATVAGGGPLVKVVVNRGELRIRSRAPHPGT